MTLMQLHRLQCRILWANNRECWVCKAVEGDA